MTPSKANLIDGGLILLGVVIGTVFISAGTWFVALIAGLVSFGLAWPIRSVTLAVVASVVITDLLFVLDMVCRVAYTQRVFEHPGEEAFLLPIIFVVETFPTVALSCIGFGRFASRLYGRKNVP